MGCYYQLCPCQETRPSISDEDIERGNKRREMDDLRREHTCKNGWKKKRCWNVSGGKTSKRTKKYPIQLPYKILLSADSLMEKMRDGSLCGFIQCDLFSCSRGTESKFF